ncbi:MAG: S8 family serine peptidase [Methanobacteriota archaeon]
MLFGMPVVAADFEVPAVGDVLAGDEVRPGTNQWIVGFYELPEDREQYAGADVVSVDEDLRFFTVYSETPALLTARVALDENVRYMESDVYDAQLLYSPNDYYVAHSSNWGMNKIGLPTAWDKTRGSTSVKDAHIDSGVLAGHQDLPSSRVSGGWDYYSGDSVPNDGSGCSWHGTHTSGTVGATINNALGFPGTAQILIRPLKIFGGGFCFAASTTNIANALKWGGNNGAQISSNSWGGGGASTTLNDAIQYSVDRGVIFVAAAGNGQCSNCVSEPWKSKESVVIIVTATDVNDAGASFNSKGPQTDVSAPGVSIGSSCGPNTNSYCILSGTSMATPYTAGVAALIKTLNPSFTHSQVQSRLKSTAKDLGTAGEDDTFGAGRIQANLAVY